MLLRKILPGFLVLATLASLSILALPPAHAAGTLYVLPATSFPTGAPVGTVFTVKIQVASIDPFNAWDISVQTDNTVISPQSLDITGNLLAVNFTTTVFPLINCINGVGTGCIATDGPGIAHSAVTGFGPPPQPGASSGLLFAITYKVVGTGAFSTIHLFNDVIANGATGLAVPHTSVDGLYGAKPDTPPIASFTVTGNNSVTGTTVNFNGGASSDPDGTVVSYAWAFGDGTSGTGVTTTHIYMTAGTGTFTVTLTVTDNGGKTGTASAVIGVLDRPPTASFTVTGNNTAAGKTVAFDASGSSDPDGMITAYAWTFGDGNSGIGVTTTHVYASPGSFTVTLTVTDNSGSTGTKSVKVVAIAGPKPPVASFTVTGNNTLTSSTVSFNATLSTDPSGTITSYAWNFGDGATGTGKTTTHSYTSAGTYSVALSVTDSVTGLSGTKTAKVGVVDRPPTASFTVSGNNTNYGSLVHFNAAASSDPDGTITSYAWNFGDGATGTGVITTHKYTNAGTFTVTLTVTDNSGSTATTSAKVTQVIDKPPIAMFTVTGNNTIAGSTVTFDATTSSDPDGTIVSYAWSFGDGSIGSGVTTTHMYAPTGSYTVTLSVIDNSGSTGSASATVVVIIASDKPPVASFTFTSGPLYVNGTVSFDASSSHDPDGTVTAYTWTFDDGTSAAGVTTTHKFTAPGRYMVSLTVTDNLGNTNSMAQVVLIMQPELLLTQVSSAPSGTVTIGQKIVFTVEVLNGGTTNESFTIKVWWGTDTVATQQASLRAGQQQNFTLTWDTTGLLPGTRTISATVSTVPGESNTADNVSTGPSLTLASSTTPFLPAASLPAVAGGASAAIILLLIGLFLVLRRRRKTPQAQ